MKLDELKLRIINDVMTERSQNNSNKIDKIRMVKLKWLNWNVKIRIMKYNIRIGRNENWKKDIKMNSNLKVTSYKDKKKHNFWRMNLKFVQ